MAAVAVVAVATAAWLRVSAPEPTASASTELYAASDPGLVGSTGRPQLVEFYHPG